MPTISAMRPVVAGLAVVLLLGSGSVRAQSADSIFDDPSVQIDVGEGLDDLYNMKFEAAARRFDRIARRYPEHPAGPFLQALNLWWEILPDLSNESRDDAFFAAMEEVIERSDRLLKQDPEAFDAMFFKGAALGFRGRLRSNRGDWFKAARDGLRAMDYVLDVAKREPDTADYAFGKGMYDYYAAAIPDKYPVLKPLAVFFPDGDRERGVEALRRTVRDGNFVRAEAAYFLLQIHYLFENDFEESVAYASWLRERYPDNSFFHAIEGRVYARWGRWSLSDPVFEEVYARYRAGRTGYNASLASQALFFLARSRMAYGDYEAALVHLDALQESGVRDAADYRFVTMGRLYAGMAHDALGRRSEAVAAYREALDTKDWSRAHKRARQYLDAPYGQ